ncbi:hypothetical protein D3C77_336970 [compost metagenome]
MNVAKLDISRDRPAVQPFPRPFVEQQVRHFIQCALRLFIGAADIAIAVALLDMHVCYEQNALLHMIEHNDPVTEHKLNILQVHIIHFMSRELLVILKQIVSKKPDRPACKWRHFRELRAPVFS